MRLMVAINDQCTINRDSRRSMVRSIDRCILRPIVRAILASCDRPHEHSWNPGTERTINCGTRRPTVRSIVEGNDRSTIHRSIVRPIVRSLVGAYDRSHEQSWHQTIWKRRNMTIDLATTDVAMAITHDLCDQSYVLSTMPQRFQHFSVAGRSSPGRKPGVTGAFGVLNMTTTLLRLILQLAITHDLCDQSYVLSTICPRFQHFSVAG